MASATTRYAAPGGTATAPQCTTPANPCTINEAATGTGVVATDEVVIAPGDYSDTAGDLGVDGFVSPIAGNLHGTAGFPRPTITLNNGSAFGAIFVSTGITVSYLSISSTVSDRAINVGGGTVDRVIARATGSFGATCAQFRGLIRNTACIATATSGVAVGTSVGTAGALTPTLRGVTAISLGASGFGLDYRVSGGGSLTVSVKSVIADGGTADIKVGGTSPSTTTMTVDHSNFATTNVLAGGTITDGGSNQTSAPLLAADKVHQLTGSPTVDAGAVDGSSGTADVDGQTRTLGAAPDIGADERGNPTTTAVGCSPSSVQAGTSSTCTLTVTDTAVTGATTPTGNVSLTSDTTGGSIGSGGVCTLVMLNPTQASCQITYTPGQVGDGSHGLTGDYLADSSHEPSQGTTSVGVTVHPTSTTVSCAPSSVPYGSPTTCTATVADTATTGKTTPTGDLNFDSDTTGGTFSSGGTCTLAPVPMSSSAASCHLTYTPGQVGDGSHLVTGSYEGDSTHAPSPDEEAVTVTPHATATGVTCTPDSLTLGIGSSTCVVAVSDTVSAGPTTATGSVDLTTSGTGTFDAGCATLAAGSCTATYTPGAVGTHQVTASYGGDTDHVASQGTDALSVSTPVAPVTPVTPTVNPLCAPLRKKLRKAKKAHDTAKVQKLKRRLRRLGC
jgi:hypothetical protein